MRQGVLKRGARWTFVVDVPNALAQRCSECRGRTWVENHHPSGRCDCGGDLDSPRAERRQIWRGGFRTEREAAIARRAFLSDLDRGADPLPPSTTLREWTGVWLASDRVAALRDSTRRRYEQILRDWVLPEFGSIEMRQIRSRHVRQLLEHSGEHMAPRSVTQIRSVLSSMMRAALEAELIDVNPVASVRRPKVDRPDLSVPTSKQLEELIDVATGSVWAIPIVLSCTTGLRRGEVLGLRWSDVNLDVGRLQVSKALQPVRDLDGSRILQLVDPKTVRSRRTVALPKLTLQRLRWAKRDQAERRLRIGPAWSDLDLVCDRGDGAPLHPDAFGKAAKRLIVQAGLDQRTRLHDLRHGVATVMLEQGVHPAVTSAVLGHSSVAFTMDTYQHVIDHMTDQAATALDNAFTTGTDESSPT